MQTNRNALKITFLGTGTSQGVPVIACKCEVCTSSNLKDSRLRSSVLIECGKRAILIDAGPDFRQQMLRADVQRLDSILITHEHKDHVAGLDDVRAYNWVLQKPMDVYSELRVLDALKREFAYAFAEEKYPGVPIINLHEIDDNPFICEDIEVIPIRGLHYELPILGYRIGNFSYLTDLNYLPEESMKKLVGSEIVVISAIREQPHLSHYSLSEAIDVIQKINPRLGIITHISHQMGKHEEVSQKLPDNIILGFDGLELFC